MVAIYRDNSRDTSLEYINSGVVRNTHTVGGKEGNYLSIHDMSGNENEWCWDKYSSDTTRVFRGGGYNSLAEQATCSYRNGAISYVPFAGFRVAHNLP
jgi:formylglycine-generating enzyme required for sulfatase activity